MEAEFSFNGVSCTEMGLTYIPSRKNVTPNLAKVDIIDSEPTYRHGGYYFGYHTKPKEFQIECFAEEIDRAKLEEILVWLRPGNQGTLVFNDRPLVHYDVVVTAAPEAEAFWDGQTAWTTISAKMNFFMKAYNPFGKLDASENAEEMERAKEYSGLIDSVPENDFTVTGTTKLLYNPGDYESDTVIRIAGSAGDGMSIRNLTNGDVCSFVELPSSPEYLEVASETGTIKLLPTFPNRLSYAYHDDGYLRLAPGLPRRNIPITYTSGSNQVTTTSILTKEDEGRYVYLNEEWLRIANVNNAHTAIVSKNMGASGTETTVIVTMNEILIEGTGTLTTCTIDFVPLVR